MLNWARKFFNQEVHEDFASQLLNCAFTSGGLAVKAATDPDIKTASAVVYAINGVLYSHAAGNIDLSAFTTEKLAAGKACLLAICLDADDEMTIVQGDAVTIPASGEEMVFSIPEYGDGVCCIGAVVIENAGSSDFTIGTTNLDATGVTDTYFNFHKVFPGMEIVVEAA